MSRSRPKGEGSPILLAVRSTVPPEHAAAWLADIERRATWLLEYENVTPESAGHARRALRWSRLARQALHQEESANDASHAAMQALHHAFMADIAQGAVQRMARDTKQQKPVHKPRRARWPDVDADIEAALKSNPGMSAKEIMNGMPDSFSGGSYYVDGQTIFDESGRQLQFGGFQKRITKVKKKLKNSR